MKQLEQIEIVGLSNLEEGMAIVSNQKPEIAATTPITLELEPGTYWFCQCGKSQDQPFCDGAHKEEGVFSPLEFTIDRKKSVKLCRCKQTATPPYCDLTHREL